MRLILILAALATLAIQATPAGATVVKRHTQTTEVHGDIRFATSHKNASAVGKGEANEARNTAGAIRAGSRIEGNTNITASQSDATAVASGRGNVAANEAGVIGGR